MTIISTGKKTPVTNTGKSDIWIDERGILHLHLHENIELDLEEAKKCFKIYEELGCKRNKVLQIMDAGKGNPTVTKAARDYAAEMGKEYFIASAIISKSLAVRMMVNFFNSFYKGHGVPFKLFPNEEEAVKWLETFRK